MKIDKLSLAGFGKFKNTTFKFKDGLNIVFGDNEAGKTTLQMFIKGMLFNLKSGKLSKDDFEFSQKKYKPWNSDEYSGSMEYYLKDGTSFKVERNFNTGSCKVYDNHFSDITGTFQTSRDRGSLFAQKHLGLNEDCFEKSVFITQGRTKISDSDRKALFDKIQNISETGYEDISFKNAERALKEAQKNYIGTDKTSVRPLDKILARIDYLATQRKVILQKREFAYEGLRANFEKLKSNIEDKKKTLGEIECRLEYLRSISGVHDDGYKHIRRLNDQIESLKSHSSFNDAERLTGKTDALKYKSRVWAYNVFIFGGLAVLFLLLGIFKTYIGYGVSVLIFIITVVAMFVRLGIVREFHRLTDEREKMLLATEAVISELGNKQDELKGIFESAGIGNIEELLLLKSEFNNKIELFTSLNKEIGLLENECEDLLSDGLFVGENGVEYTNNFSCDDEIARIDAELEELEENRAKLIEVEFSIKKALEVLALANEEMQKRFMPKLNAKIGNIVNQLTGGRYSDLRINSNSLLMASEPSRGSIIDVTSLSRGTLDQIYLALRLSAGEVLSDAGEDLPLIMDEIFSQYDDTRTRDTFRLLKDMGRERQMILFTCKSREVEIAKEVFGEDFNLIYCSR